MDRILRQCNPVQGAAFGQTPTLDLQLGPRYRSLLLEIFATAAAAKTVGICDVLDMITVKIGGNPQRTHTAWELDQVNRSYGAQYGLNAYNYDGDALHYTGGTGVPDAPVAAKKTVFYLPIFFREPWRQSYTAKEMFAWYTAWQDGSVLPSFSVDLKIPAISANVLANSAITINAYAETDSAVGPLDANKKPVAMITKWKRQGLVYGGTGEQVFVNLPKREVYTQISLFSSYANGKGPFAGNPPATIITDQNDVLTPAFDAITRAKIEVDSRVVRDISKIANDQSLVDDDFNESALPPDRFDIVFDKSDVPTDGLIMEANGQAVKDFRLTATLASAAGLTKTIQSISQVYGAIER
jgi:hypothetical protein